MTNFILDEIEEASPGFFSKLLKSPKAIFALSALIIFGGSTYASNLSIGGGRIEYGQGQFTVKACDSWISIGLFPTATTENGLSKVQSIELVGLDPQKCAGKVIRFKFYDSSTATALPMYTGVIGSDTTTGVITGGATTLGVLDTSTAWNSATTTYANYAMKALTIIDQVGANIGYYNDYLSISYNKSAGSWKIFMFQPLCFMNQVYRVTVESAPLVA
jgi:hypothetical protein